MLCSLPPSVSLPPAHIIPEDNLLSEMSSERAARGDMASRKDLSPLDRFASTLQRHEKIAMKMTLHSCIQLPYQDYVPCPGSGSGSPALSVATDHIRPGTAPLRVEPPLPRLSVGKLALGSIADPQTLLHAGPTPMSRFLADVDSYEWMAPTFDNTTVLPTIETDDVLYTRRDSPEPSLTLEKSPSYIQQDTDTNSAAVDATQDNELGNHSDTHPENLETTSSDDIAQIVKIL